MVSDVELPLMQRRGRMAIALVHYPCLDKTGGVYATSLTNLDLHDIARAGRTYGVDAFYIVHPVVAQQELARSIASFWDDDDGGKRKNPDRAEALSIVRVAPTVEAAIFAESAEVGGPVWVVSTSAKRGDDDEVSFEGARGRIAAGPGTFVMFGTGHGLAPEVMALASSRLPPVMGSASYNHLSVRSAVAIFLDRLLGDRE